MNSAAEDYRSQVSGLTFRNQAFINGKYVPAASGRTFDKVSPINGWLLTSVAESDGKDVEREYVVSDVSLTGPARNLLAEGSDIIVRVLSPQPARDVRSAADFEPVLSRLRAGDLVTLLLYNVRQEATRVVTLKVGD